MLEDRGHSVDIAATGEEGLALFASSTYDVIAVDYLLPGMNGIDVCRKLLADDPELPIVMVTGAGDQNLMIEALDLGVSQYVVKDDQSVYLKLLPSVIENLSRRTTANRQLRLAEETRQDTMEQAKKLEEARSLFDTLSNAAPIGIFYSDNDGIAQYVNEALAAVTGHTVEELTGEPWHSKIHPEDRNTVTDNWLENVHSEEDWNIEFRFLRSDGTVAWVSGHASPQISADGKVIGHVGTIMDITGRKNREAGLERRIGERSRELDFQKTALDEHAIVSTTNIKGDIVQVNEKFCEISGYTRDELIGQNHRMLKSGEHSIEFYRDLWGTITSGRPWHGEIKNNKKDGGHYWVKATIVPFPDENGNLFQYVSIRTDITERKQAEAALLQSKAMAEEASLAKSRFLSSMSHELRTPLNAILGFAQILEMNNEKTLSKSQMEHVDHIMSGGNHLLELINKVLDLTKIESGKTVLSIEPVQINELCLECLSLIDYQAKHRGLRIKREPGTHISISTDCTLLKQILINLLSNAVKYNREDGSITLSCAMTPDNQIKITVTDTGKGIARNDQDKLFEPFDRLGKEASTIEGTGIGLTICKKLTEVLGGRIGVESEVGKGSTFWIVIPDKETAENSG